MAAFERPDCILPIGQIIWASQPTSQRYYVLWTEYDIMGVWVGRQCGSPNAMYAGIVGYPKLRTRQIAPRKRVVQPCGTRVALMGGQEQQGSRLGAAAGREVRNYALAVDATSRGCPVGASAIRATPIAINTADPISSLRAIQCSNPCTPMTAA